jgi:hypothetical protein
VTTTKKLLTQKDFKGFSVDELQKIRRALNRQISEVAPKRPRGSKILEAFQQIPSRPIDLEEFASKFDVSTGVLRQIKRFDQKEFQKKGTVTVRTINGTLHIWRDENIISSEGGEA